MLSRLSEFIKDVRIEASKVTWPTRKELQESTMVVVVTVTIISIFTAVVDRVVVRVITLVI
jgi:preprotein translocase subunit SecE